LKLGQTFHTLFWNVDILHRVQGCSDDFFAPVRAKIQVAWEIESKSRQETPIVLCSVKSLGPKKFLALVGPTAGKKIYVKQSLVPGWNVLQEGKDTRCWMLVPEHVEYESCFGRKSISVFGNPAGEVRLEAPP
jgi:hypothetical protein